MDAAERLIAGEWFEIRERLRRPDELHDYFSRTAVRPGEIHRPVASSVLRATAAELERTIEGGIFEYKRGILRRMETELSEAEFSSEVFAHLDELTDRATAWILAASWERALLTQEVEFKRLSPAHHGETDDELTEAEESRTPPAASALEEAEGGGEDGAAEIRRIIADVHEIVAADPSARMHSAIKSIMVQLRKYREEAETYRKLRQKASSYRVELYSRTFAATFQKIFETIRRNYETYMEEQEQLHRRERASMLAGLDTREWSRIVMRQIEAMSRVRAVLMFLSEQHSGMREPLVDLGRDARVVRRVVDDEEEQAADVAGGEAAATRLGRLIANECAGRFRRWAEAGPR